jgi:hypothetical protein
LLETRDARHFATGFQEIYVNGHAIRVLKIFL